MRGISFKLEQYFRDREFNLPLTLSSSDCETWTPSQLFALQGDAAACEEMRRRYEETPLGYTESQGHPELREAIARLYRTMEAENILIGAPEELIYLTMWQCLEPGDHVIAMFPAYQSLYALAEDRGCEVSLWQADEGWDFRIETLRVLLRDNTRMVIVNFPHNPTGAQLSGHVCVSLLAALHDRRDVILFSDEMYRFLEFRPGTRLSPACDMRENAISLGGMSKSFGLAGIRIGWIATANEALTERILKGKDWTSICPPAPSEILAIAALRAQHAILQRNLGIISQNLEVARHFFNEEFPGIFSWVEPRAGSVCFPRPLAYMPIEEVCAALERKEVLLVPGSQFDYPGNHFR
ncbi:MAG: aminotransferase class I/II-fold pyridoxal phosphate-dependent enzyme, partial [Patescibacteria group bacterium]|nr:aminotransferase class I/II-fold pyridoxal phosphate-dependent enzyme [Patescibacteria group bacterium]